MDNNMHFTSKIPLAISFERVNLPHPYYDSPNCHTEEAIAGLNRMIAKKEAQGGWLEGFHGTSMGIARGILTNGFNNQTCVNGVRGIHFHEDTHPGNAHLHGKDKAAKTGEEAYAVIRARSNKASPDLWGRPQWHALAEDIEILDVEYFNLDGTSRLAP